MTATVITPERRGQIVDLGNGRWEKQLLPLGSIDYHGQKITFDKDYLEQLVKSFNQTACGPVPFQLADAKNTHTNDPERRRGTVQGLQLKDDGLYALIDLNKSGQELVEEFPDLGVSARIYENYERADGQFFPAALQHVLGTLDPHVPGMRPWQAVALSNDFSGTVIDLSDSEFDTGREEKKPVATKSDLKSILAKLKKSDDEAELSDEELDQLLEITDAIKDTGSEEETVDDDATDDKDEAELTDEELDKLIAEAEADAAGSTEDDSEDDQEGSEEEGGDPVKPDPQLIAASNANRTAIELANARIEQQNIELTAMRTKMAAKEFDQEVRTFAEVYGIPPRITALARPLLEGDGHTVELANGDEVDAGAVMRKVLVELGSTFKALDLTALIGNGEEEPNDDEAESRKRADEDTRNFVNQIKDSYSF